MLVDMTDDALEPPVLQGPLVPLRASLRNAIDIHAIDDLPGRQDAEVDDASILLQPQDRELKRHRLGEVVLVLELMARVYETKTSLTGSRG